MVRRTSIPAQRIAALFLGIMVVFLFASGAFAGHEDVAPLPDDVVKTLVQNATPHHDMASERLHRYLDDLSEVLRVMAPEDACMPEKGRLDDLELVHEDVRLHFDTIRQKLLVLNLPEKVKAWDEIEARVEDRFNSLRGVLQELGSSPNYEGKKAALEKARGLLHELHGRVKEQDADTKPFPTWRTWPERAVSKQSASDKVPQYSLDNLKSAKSLFASLGNSGPPPIPNDAQCCTYTAADLAADGQDIQFTTDIKNLAQQLGYSPAKIYQWVHDNIKFEVYYGSLKGAQGTLISGAGNATDHASLLIALLRASNIPARYVKGQIGVDDTSPSGANGKGPLWIGAKGYHAAESILNIAGISAGTDTDSSTQQVVGIFLDHVWVEACVPYGHYRGAPFDTKGYRWIPLDASFKGPTYQPGIATNVTFDYTTGSTGYFHARTDQLPYEIYSGQVETYIKGVGPNNNNNTLADVGYTGTPDTLDIDILPASLPYTVVQFYNWTNTGTPETAVLPDTHRYKLTVTVQDANSNQFLSTVLSYPTATLGRISLSYTPSDQPSQTLWNSWGGDLGSLPAGTVNVLPVVKLEGTTVATGATPKGVNPLTLNTAHKLILKLDIAEETYTPSCVNDSGNTFDPVDSDTHCINKTVYTNIKAGNYHALQSYAHQASDTLIAQRAQNLIAATRANPAPTPAQATAYEATLGEYLNVVLLKYLRYTEDSSKTIGQLNGVYTLFGNSIGLTSSNMKVSYMFDVPFAVSPGGLLVDVKGGMFETIKLDTTQTTVKGIMQESWPTFKLCCYDNSAFEHYVWQENARLDAVSTVRGIQFANETAIPIVTLTSANIGSWNSLMDSTMANYKTQITNYVNDGATVTVPKNTISYSEDFSGQNSNIKWNGAVFMVENENPVHSAMSYISAPINGSLGGGYPLIDEEPLTDIYTPESSVPQGVINNTGFSNSTTETLGQTPNTPSAGDPVNVVHREHAPQ